jgi:hypothetical protein
VAVLFGGGKRERVCRLSSQWQLHLVEGKKEGGFAARWHHSGGKRKGRLEEGELTSQWWFVWWGNGKGRQVAIAVVFL